jgi:hypothetical protein
MVRKITEVCMRISLRDIASIIGEEWEKMHDRLRAINMAPKEVNASFPNILMGAILLGKYCD